MIKIKKTLTSKDLSIRSNICLSKQWEYIVDKNIHNTLIFNSSSFTGNCGLVIFYHPRLTEDRLWIKHKQIRNIFYKYLMIKMLIKLRGMHAGTFVVSDKHNLTKIDNYSPLNIKEFVSFNKKFFSISPLIRNPRSPNMIFTATFKTTSKKNISSVLTYVKNMKIEGVNEQSILNKLYRYYNIKLK